MQAGALAVSRFVKKPEKSASLADGSEIFPEIWAKKQVRTAGCQVCDQGCRCGGCLSRQPGASSSVGTDIAVAVSVVVGWHRVLTRGYSGVQRHKDGCDTLDVTG